MSLPKIERNLEICERYYAKKKPLRIFELAPKYGVSKWVIMDVVKQRRRWEQLSREKANKNGLK